MMDDTGMVLACLSILPEGYQPFGGDNSRSFHALAPDSWVLNKINVSYVKVMARHGYLAEEESAPRLPRTSTYRDNAVFKSKFLCHGQ